MQETKRPQSQPELTQISTLKNVAMHSLYQGWKRCLGIGQLSIFNDQQKSIYISLNNSKKRQIQIDTIFYRIKYDKITSYLTEAVEGGFYALSFENQSVSLGEWENMFEEMVELKGFQKIIDIKKGLEYEKEGRKIRYHYPKIDTHQIHSVNFLTPIYKLKGSIANSISSKFSR